MPSTEIAVKIDDVTGTCSRAGHDGELNAFALADVIQVPSGTTKSGGPPPAVHSDVQVVRFRDSASPALSERCAACQPLGDVIISVFGAGDNIFLQYELGDAYISRMESETVDESGSVFLPYEGSPGSTIAPSLASIGGLIATNNRNTERLSPRPYVVIPPGAPGDQEVERLWFNFQTVKWIHTPYLNNLPGAPIIKTWNIDKGQEEV